MKYNNLKVIKKQSIKRVGRGIAAGQGKTAGRGTKGQNSRAGSTRRLGFEGGQNPLVQRLPKLRGFTSHVRKTAVVYTGQLNTLNKAIIDNNVLADSGLVASTNTKVKLIKKGELDKKISVTLQFASHQAVEQIQKAGGNFAKTKFANKLPQKKAGEDK
ncbi:MAG TPA: 50S ribosomal protein L15 [Candidatus Saccharimonadales bacterium]|nr:50S ribosomal protein L15 [Candidatus Saccharimonadales bacterium]